MMKTPDDIKKGLECCSCLASCDECPYQVYVDGSFGCDECGCDDGLLPDALAYIQQLETERDEAYEAICDHCQDIPCRESDCYWYIKWRGVQKEE